MTILMVCLVILGGALIAAQGPIYTRLAEEVGGALPATFLAFSTATTGLGLLLCFRASSWPRRDVLLVVPPWLWLGGLIGVYVVLVSIVAVPRLGVAPYLVCVVLGQLAAGAAYDHFGAFGGAVRLLTPTTALGLLLVCVGAILVSTRSH